MKHPPRLTMMIVTALMLGGCRGVGNLFHPGTWFSHEESHHVIPRDPGGSYAALIQMAHWAFAPGLTMILIGSLGGALALAWAPIAFLAKFFGAVTHTGVVFLAIGLGCAAAPWALDVGGRWAMWASIVLGVIVAGMWIWGHRKTLMHGNGIAKALTP